MRPERQPASRPTGQGARTFTRSARKDFDCPTAKGAPTGGGTLEPGPAQLTTPVRQPAVEPPGQFARISRALPTTRVVKDFKGTLVPLRAIRSICWQLLILAVVPAAVMAGLVGRWRLVATSALRPSLDW